MATAAVPMDASATAQPMDASTFNAHAEAAAAPRDPNALDANGLTPLMTAVLHGQLDTSVQLALGGADLSRRDLQGRTALELAIGANRREISLALLLIATGKFSKPLTPLLPIAVLIRLQVWVLDRAGKNAKAAAVVAQQHITWLTEPGAAGPAGGPAAPLTSLQSLVMILIWGARCGHTSLCEQGAHYFAQQAARGTHVRELVEAADNEGHGILHALVLAGQGAAARSLLTALPRAEAMMLLHRRTHAGAVATRLGPAVGMPAERHAAVAAATADLVQLAQEFQAAGGEETPGGGVSAPPVPTASGRGGAVRRRKSSHGDVGLAADKSGVAGLDPDPQSSDDGKTAAADLLSLAAAATSAASTGRARAGSERARQRDAKPYQRRGGARGGRGGGGRGGEQECWLPGGLWWEDNSTPMPTGRQPGELAGWQPLAGDLTQQRLQEQKTALSHKEQLVRGLGSRDDAAAYLQQLGHGGGGPSNSAEAITSSVDDSAIERSSTFKQLASWGGFRRAFVEGADVDGAAGAPAQSTGEGASAESEEAARRVLHEQLMAKRAEVLATQKKLESLSLEQQALEQLVTRVG